MNNEFVSFELAQKLKEKGFSCKHPFAMYDKGGKFHPLYTSAEVCYYDFDDFDDKDTFCPTIEQVLTWLRNEKNIHVVIPLFNEGCWWEVRDFNREVTEYCDNEFDSYEEAAIAGIEYVLDNLI